MSKPAARYGYLTSPSDSWHFPSGFRPEMVSFLRDFAGSSWNPASGNIVQGRKFSMFRAGETRQKKLNLLKQLPSEIHTSSVPSPSSEGRELSYGVEFINNLSKSTATCLKRFIYAKNNCDFKIISKNLDDDINIDELAELVSVTPEDGEFFKDWLSCYVTAASAETTTPAYNITILNHDLKLEFLQPKLNMFCTSNHIRLISIRSHHVVLRCKLKKKLSKFTTKDGGNTGKKNSNSIIS
ncbi:unnamed protein product [Adineta steineri]|uniref:Uncharacterized protein n=1 Tax=Adineta steineri TaxID=433720 RepID=A0A818ITV6_9BILA|nr:unnamed protein product [Adineta steineri]